MACETVTRVIDDEEIQITPLPASKGWPLLIALGKMLGGPIGKAGAAKLLDASVESDALANVVEALAERLDETKVYELTMRLLSGCQVRTPKGWVLISATFDVLFMGRYGLLMKVLAFAIEVNYGVPLGALLASAASGEARAAD